MGLNTDPRGSDDGISDVRALVDTHEQPSISEQSRSVHIDIPAGAGEMVQGQLRDERHFLITNPIALWTRVRVTVSPSGSGVSIYPPSKFKAKRAVAIALALLQHVGGHVHIHIKSQIPAGKGLASSTADIVGAVEATALALGRSLTPEQISAIAIAIEPSDGLMYRGVVAYNHRQGQLIECFGPPPGMSQLLIDLGGSVDTIRFNQIPKNYSNDEFTLLEEAFAIVRDGIRTGNLIQIGRAATISTIINQRILDKTELPIIQQIACAAGAYGVICAHSGTLLSLIFDPEDKKGPEKARALLASIRTRRLISCIQTSSVASW